MYMKKLPAMLALPLMAIAIALLTCDGKILEALTLVFGKGPTKLAPAMVNVIFGGMLAHVVYTSGIAGAIVREASELAGDHPLVVALVMVGATALVFASLVGLGSIIMVGTIVLPIMIGVGIRPLPAVGMFLFGVTIGGTWNLANWGLYRDVLGVSVERIAWLSAMSTITLVPATLAYILINTRRRLVLWATPVAVSPEPRTSVPGYALLTPVIPVALLLGFQHADILSAHRLAGSELDVNAALAMGALYGLLTTCPRRCVNALTGAIVEGTKSVAPVLGLMVGIGMLVTVLMSDQVAATMKPMLQSVLPGSRLGYVLFFGLLSFLALYRGPLNLYGLGAGLGAIMTTMLKPGLVAGALISTGVVQGVSDPTNTYNVWCGGYAKVDVNEILRSTLPYVFVANLLALALIALLGWATL
jgi:hypothetical protein